MKLLEKLKSFSRAKSSGLPGIGYKAQFRYRLGYIRDGKRHLVTPWVSNLILDSGLNKVASMSWAECFQTCIFGNQVAPTPVSRNGGAITFSQATTTITASGNFFVAADTGRLFKFDSGEECYLTYVSATQATASISRTVGSGPGTVWYVNQTAVESVFAYSTGYGATGGDNGTSAVGAVVTMKRTYTGAAAGSATTLTEIGFNSGAANVNIFDRDIIVGGVSLLIGDIPLAVAELILTFTGTTLTACGNVGTGYDTSGDSQICTLNLGAGSAFISSVATSGASQQTTAAGEPSFNGAGGPIYIYSNPPAAMGAFPAFTAGSAAAITGVNGSGQPDAGMTLAAYTPGSFFRDITANWSISAVVTTITGFVLNYTSPGFAYKFTTPFAKAGTQTLSITLRKSWQRILTN